MSILHHYKNGNYMVTLFSDGTKVRHTEDDEFAPDFAENCDVKITDRCDGGCPMCYEGCSPIGRHGDILNAKFLNSLHPGTEMALNGNDLTHPHLISFLKELKDRKIIANLTVNQMHFERHYNMVKAMLDMRLIWGLGISLRDPTYDFIQRVKAIPNAVIHTIVGILDLDQIERLSDNNLKILLLGYKCTGRGITYAQDYTDEICANIRKLKEQLPNMFEHFKCVSFDNLAIEQLDVKNLMAEEEWEKFYMGDDGAFTFYIDLVDGMFSKNSVIAKSKSLPIADKTIDEMFEIVKNTEWS